MRCTGDLQYQPGEGKAEWGVVEEAAVACQACERGAAGEGTAWTQDWGGSHLVQRAGRVNIALEDLICLEGKGQMVLGFVMNQVGSQFSR